MAELNDTRRRLVSELRLLLPELLEASTEYRAAKARFRRRKALFADSVNHDVEVSQDRLAKKALSDCAWFGNEMERISTTMLALLAVRDQGGRQSGGPPPT